MKQYDNKMMVSEGGIILIGDAAEREIAKRNDRIVREALYHNKAQMPKFPKKTEPCEKGKFRMMQMIDGKVCYQDVPAGSTIVSGDGRKRYQVAEDGSLRRIKESE